MLSPARIIQTLVLLVSIAGVLPLYPYLDLFPRVLLPIAAISGMVAYNKGVKLPTIILTLASIAIFVIYAARFGHNNVAAPAANLLASLLAIRLIGEQSARSSLQACGLSVFCLAASTLFALDPIFLFSLVLLSFFVVCTLVLLTFHETDKTLILTRCELLSLGKLAVWTTGVSIPLMLMFFIILPRTQFPLWNAFAGKGQTTSGVSDRVEPGRSATIETSLAVAFRAEMAAIDPEALYWRCMVFNRFSSDAWEREPPPSGEVDRTAVGKRVQQTIFFEPGSSKYLPALDQPLQVRATRSSTSGDLVTTQNIGGSNRSKIEAISTLGEALKVNRINREFYLRLPSELPPKLTEVANGIMRRGKSDLERLTLAKEFFIASRLRYATTNLPTGRNHLDSFLFTTKKGHCEFFASSFALIMRKAGVPARVVGGYYGGVYNQIGGYYVVSEDMAHAWVEVFIDGVGWQRVDPSRWSAGFAEIGAHRDKGLLRRLSTLLDTFAYYWHATVITYDLGNQLSLARNTGAMLQNINLPRITTGAVRLFVLATAGIFAWFIYLKFRKGRAVNELAAQFVRLSGYQSPPKGKGILEIATEWHNDEAARFAAIYAGAIYKDREISKAEQRELATLLRNLKALKSKG
jgi:transglutaminase-like putative cysteine protease